MILFCGIFCTRSKTFVNADFTDYTQIYADIMMAIKISATICVQSAKSALE
jgi:hypothetical protein